MTDRYDEWRDFYAKHVSSWMSLEELRAECGKLITTDGTSPELLLIHAMHLLERYEQRNEALRAERDALLDVLREALKLCSAELFAQCADQPRAMQYVEQAHAAMSTVSMTCSSSGSAESSADYKPSTRWQKTATL